MPRVKTGTTSKARHKRVFKKTKGYKHGRKNVFKHAKQALLKADEYRSRSKYLKKRSLRSTWIIRINAACMANGVKYNQFIKNLNEKKLPYSRKDLSDIIEKDINKFNEILKQVMS